MGSWNGTCALTGLSIFSGDRVVVVLLVKTGRPYKDGGGYCYSQAEWQPFHVPMRGSYDDYGAADLDPSLDADTFCDAFQGDIHTGEKFRFYGRKHDLRDFSAKTPSSVLKSIERGVVQWKSEVYSFTPAVGVDGFIDERDSSLFKHGFEFCNMSFMLIHESVYDAIAGDNALHSHVLHCTERLQSQLDSLSDLHRQVIEKDPENQEVVQFAQSLLDMKTKMAVESCLCSEGEGWVTIASWANARIREAITLKAVMREMRKVYSPQSGTGSQADNGGAITLAYDAAKLILCERARLYDAEPPEDDEEDED